jgi:hypothetical protein
VGGSSIAVHGLKFSSQNEYLLKYYKFCRIYDNTLLPFCKAGILQQEQKISGNFPCVSKYAQKDLEILGDMPDLPGISKGEIRGFTKNGCPLTADIQGKQGEMEASGILFGDTGDGNNLCGVGAALA